MTRAPLSIVLCLFAAAIALGGCNKDDTSSASNPRERVGVVNIGQIEQELHWNHDMDAAAKEYETDLRKQYADLVARFDAELQDKMKKLGIKEGDTLDKLKPAERQELSVASANAQMVRSQGLQTAQAYYNDYRIQLERSYRNALAPLIEEIAKEKKMTIVMAQNEALPYSDPTVDISKSVIQAAHFKPPSVQKPQPRKLQVMEKPSFGGGGTSGPTTQP